MVLHVLQARRCQRSAVVWSLLQSCDPYYLAGPSIASIGLSSDLHKVFHVKKPGWYNCFPRHNNGTIVVISVRRLPKVATTGDG